MSVSRTRNTHTQRSEQARAPATTAPAGNKVADKAGNKAQVVDAQPRTAVVGDAQSAGSGAAQAAEKAAPRQSGVGGSGALRFKVEQNLEGKKFVPTDDVKELLTRYEPGGIKGLSRPMERVLQTVATIDKAIQSNNGSLDALVDSMATSDLRKPLFALEAQLRLYEDKLGKSVGKDLDKVKALEDVLGEWGLRRDLLKAVDGKDVPPKVLAQMKTDERTARSAVAELVGKEWRPDTDKRGQIPVLNKIVDNQEKADWPGSYEKDKKYIKGAIAGHIKDMLETPLDLNDMQEGIHELRRQARWIPLFMLNAGGAIQLDETRNPVKSLTPLLTSKEASSPFARMPEPSRERDPIMISKSLYLSNSQFIAQLGDVKDRGEMPEYIGEIYVKVGLAHDAHEGTAMARKMMGRTETDESIRGEAKKLWEAFDKTRTLEGLLKEFGG